MTASSRGAGRDVPIAEYSYRHQAEFAAGFLRDAGIPYRLQIDDAGGWDAGVTIGRPAVLWVRAEDVEEARELLGLDEEEEQEDEPSSALLEDVAPSQRPPAAERHSLSAPSRERHAPGLPSSEGQRPSSEGGAGGLTFEPLCGTERIVAGLIALALFFLASWGGEGAVPWVGVWESVALFLALAFGLSAVSGQTIGVLKAILRALSGIAP